MPAPDSPNPPHTSHSIYAPDNWVIFRLPECFQPRYLYSWREIIVHTVGVHLSLSPMSTAWDVSVAEVAVMGSRRSSRDVIEMTSRTLNTGPASGNI